MTHAEHRDAEHHGVRQEEDRISTGRIVLVGIGSLAIFAIGIAFVAVDWHARMSAATPPPIPAEAGRSKIGMVEQQVFEVARRGERDRLIRLERLGSYGWVDRRTGVAHIPIDGAMQLVEKGVRARGGAAQQAREVGGQP
jgi:hypothetical protein